MQQQKLMLLSMGYCNPCPSDSQNISSISFVFLCLSSGGGSVSTITHHEPEILAIFSHILTISSGIKELSPSRILCSPSPPFVLPSWFEIEPED
jgi:hypothetical protein